MSLTKYRRSLVHYYLVTYLDYELEEDNFILNSHFKLDGDLVRDMIRRRVKKRDGNPNIMLLKWEFTKLIGYEKNELVGALDLVKIKKDKDGIIRTIVK